MENYYLSRGLAFMIDLFIIGLIAVLIGFLPITKELDNIIFYIILVVWFFKDIVNKDGSIGKNILGIKLKCNNPNSRFIMVNKVLRNITLLIWPIEAILVILFKKRIGDFVFGTYVEKKQIT
ncbi:hypothetical protein ATE84_5156 [Aquimarina sp. MAR_2010_214]|uniref:hypothetical protein n=1 Tax=Aquimarina sp. MAR_2010_214 TaxID=1250026 RepID=UPI000C6FD02C|nr:hypothetical protein [Aquimarina sp. MAR_2010_214]PKV53023.1 hypothetical protein ATE84_5156 [Aquimarina sp. MAR_2010_214]